MTKHIQAEQISAFLDGELPEPEARRFLADLAQDPAATAELQRMLKLRELIAGALAPVEAAAPRLPEPLQQRWQTAIRAEAARPAMPASAATRSVTTAATPKLLRPKPSLWRTAVPMAATVLVAAGVLWMFSHQDASPSRDRLVMNETGSASARNSLGTPPAAPQVALVEPADSSPDQNKTKAFKNESPKADPTANAGAMPQPSPVAPAPSGAPRMEAPAPMAAESSGAPAEPSLDAKPNKIFTRAPLTPPAGPAPMSPPPPPSAMAPRPPAPIAPDAPGGRTTPQAPATPSPRPGALAMGPGGAPNRTGGGGMAPAGAGMQPNGPAADAGPTSGLHTQPATGADDAEAPGGAGAPRPTPLPAAPTGMTAQAPAPATVTPDAALQPAAPGDLPPSEALPSKAGSAMAMQPAAQPVVTDNGETEAPARPPVDPREVDNTANAHHDVEADLAQGATANDLQPAVTLPAAIAPEPTYELVHIPYNDQNVALIRAWVEKHGGSVRTIAESAPGEPLAGPPFLSYVKENRSACPNIPAFEVTLPTAEIPAAKAYAAALKTPDQPTTVGQDPAAAAAPADMELHLGPGQNDNNANK